MLTESDQDSIQPQPRRTPLVTIFNGERYDLGAGVQPEYYVQLSTMFREYMHYFGEALPTFLQIALRINKGGWSYPTVPLIAKGSGQSEDTVAIHLNFLCGLEIPGYGRVLLRINKKETSPDGRATGKFGNNRYKVFPTAQDISDNKQFERPARLRKRQAEKVETIISFPFEYQKPAAEISKIENSQNEKIETSSSNLALSENNKQHDMSTITTFTMAVQVAPKDNQLLKNNKESIVISEEITVNSKSETNPKKSPKRSFGKKKPPIRGLEEPSTEKLPTKAGYLKNGKKVVVIPPISEKLKAYKVRLKNPDLDLSDAIDLKKKIADERTTELLAFYELAKAANQAVVATETDLFNEDRKLVNDLTILYWMIQSLYGKKFPEDMGHLIKIRTLARNNYRLKDVILDKYNPQVVGDPLLWIDGCVRKKNKDGGIANTPPTDYNKTLKPTKGKSAPNSYLKSLDGEPLQKQVARLKGLIDSNDFLDSSETARQKLDVLEAVEILEKKLTEGSKKTG